MKTLAILAAILAVANAAPVLSEDVDAENSTLLEKRDTEILYLENCSGSASTSDMAYYPSSAAGDSGQAPSINNLCTTSHGYTNWEGNSISCTFPSGVTFTSNIAANAQSLANYAYAGSGYNGKNWKCYKDNKRTIYSTCTSIYYCLPA